MKMNILKWSLLFLIITGSAQLTAQVVQCRVTLSADRLLPEDQAILAEIPRQLTDYINNYTWANEHPDIVIQSSLNIVIETVTRRDAGRIYRGQFLVNSKSGENYLNKATEFPYQTGQSFELQDALFIPLLGLVDYYINMIIAGELDSYILKGGNLYYDKARNIADNYLVSNSSLGWRGRLDDAVLITDGDHAFLRDAKFYFYEGLFYVEYRNDYQKAPEYCNKVVELLGQVYRLRPNSSALKRFLDAHYQEFCKLFEYDSDPANLERMTDIDNRHRETYEECGL